jgi:hypothetical protein
MTVVDGRPPVTSLANNNLSYFQTIKDLNPLIAPYTGTHVHSPLAIFFLNDHEGATLKSTQGGRREP